MKSQPHSLPHRRFILWTTPSIGPTNTDPFPVQIFHGVPHMGAVSGWCGAGTIAQFFLIRWVTAFSKPSRVNSNMGKISRMYWIVGV